MRAFTSILRQILISLPLLLATVYGQAGKELSLKLEKSVYLQEKTSEFESSSLPFLVFPHINEYPFYDGKEYIIHLKSGQHTPHPWVNVIANPQFGFLVSEFYRPLGYQELQHPRRLPLEGGPSQGIAGRHDRLGALLRSWSEKSAALETTGQDSL